MFNLFRLETDDGTNSTGRHFTLKEEGQILKSIVVSKKGGSAIGRHFVKFLKYIFKTTNCVLLISEGNFIKQLPFNNLKKESSVV